jgi:arginine/lysine/ornithine decarboxylase
VVPGQRITPTIVQFLQQGMDEGMYVKGAADPSLHEIRVVA